VVSVYRKKNRNPEESGAEGEKPQRTCRTWSQNVLEKGAIKKRIGHRQRREKGAGKHLGSKRY